MFDPGEPNTVASGMRGGYNSDFDGEGGEFQSRPTDRFAQDHDIHRPGPQGQPRPDAGETHEEGHDIPRVPPPDPRPDYGEHRRRPEGHYFYPPPPPMPMPTSVSTVQKGWFFLTKRQKLREDESRSSKTSILSYQTALLTSDTVLQNLSKRLEHDIKEMMISNGETRKSRKRRDLQEPLQRARQEVLKEQLIREELFEEQKVRAETKRAEEKARFLRASRVSRPSDEKISIDEWLDSEDEDYVILRSYRGPDGIRIDPEQGRPEVDRRFGFQQAHVYRRRPDPDGTEINRGRAPPVMERRQPFQEDRWELHARERHTAAGEDRLKKHRQEFKIERKRFEEEKRRPRAEATLRREHGEHEHPSKRPSARVVVGKTHDSETDEVRYVWRPYPDPDGSKIDPDPDRLGEEQRQSEDKGPEGRLSRERQAASNQEHLRTQQSEPGTERQRFEEGKRRHADDKIKEKRRGSQREGQSEEDGIKRPDHNFHRKPNRSAREEEKSGREREYPGQHEEDEKARRDRLKHDRDLRIYKEPPDWKKRSGGWSLF